MLLGHTSASKHGIYYAQVDRQAAIDGHVGLGVMFPGPAHANSKIALPGLKCQGTEQTMR